jgi:hypothetical protein
MAIPACANASPASGLACAIASLAATSVPFATARQVGRNEADRWQRQGI